jgi:head-tail adaptor
MGLGDQRHRVVFQQRGETPASDGGYTETWTDLTPLPLGWKVQISPASPNDLERATAGTVVTQVTAIVRGRYHPGITTASRMVFGSRTFSIVGTRNVEERGRMMELLAVELQA